MIDYEKAFGIVLRRAKKLAEVELPLRECAGLILARNVRAKERIPRFDSSSVDGFGIGHADIGRMKRASEISFALRGAIRAGDEGALRLSKGSACLINTGAPVPRSVAAVVMKEKSRIDGNALLLSGPVKSGENIRPAGAEFRRGDLLLPKGALLTPPALGLLAAAGYSGVDVIRPPKVTVVVTGSELRPPGGKLPPGGIWDSLSVALESALRALRCASIRTIRVKDDPAAIRRALAKAMEHSDLVVTTGGVSVGDRDHVKESYAALGARTLFWRVAIKPGKPAWFGMKGKTLCFGLPGNPVSAMIAFHLFVRPAILRMCGHEDVRPLSTAALLAADLVKQTDRLEFVRAELAKGTDGRLLAFPVEGQESHMLGGLSRAHGLILFPRRKNRLRKGEEVRIQFLDWGLS